MMSLKLLLQKCAVRFTSSFLRLKQIYPVFKINFLKDSTKMEPVQKKQKLVLEECELIIEINKKGECSFDVMSKIETVYNGKTLDFSANSKSGDDCIRKNKNKTVSGIDIGSIIDGNDDSGDKKGDNNECVDKIPPKSKYVALDCEFVGVLGDISALGRCSIVNYDEEVICDIYARPVEKITSYRTQYSGITKAHMKHAIPIECALSQIADIIKDKIVVGHDVNNDFGVLGFRHPEHMVRDTVKCSFLREKLRQENSTRVSLKNMAKVLLGKNIQKHSHCSVIDATTTMQLYKLVREEWETKILNNNKNKSKPLDDPDQPPGKSKGKQNMNKKGRSSRPRFGQILGGSINIHDYFKNGAIVLKNGVKDSADHQEEHFVESGSKSNTNLDHEVDISNSHSFSENGYFHSLRDGTEYHSSNSCQERGPAASRKRKHNFENTEKLNLKTVYDKNIKHLLHDDFWNAMNSSVN